MKDFQNRVRKTLDEIGRETLAYDETEFWMVERIYQQIEDYASKKELFNTAVALPLIRALHNGSHRKGTAVKDGHTYRLPYMIHCLRVCLMLIDLKLPFNKEDEDIVLAAALCHDMIEDIPFANGGTEMMTLYHLDKRVYHTVRLVSKRKDFTLEEHQQYFDNIMNDRFALMVKLSDRGNNVEDLYNMKIWKVHEYVEETRKYFFPMCDFGMKKFPELQEVLAILRDKMLTLTESAEALVIRYERKEYQMLTKLEELREENRRLTSILQELEG